MQKSNIAVFTELLASSPRLANTLSDLDYMKHQFIKTILYRSLHNNHMLK
jgi:hypothetical protein